MLKNTFIIKIDTFIFSILKMKNKKDQIKKHDNIFNKKTLFFLLLILIFSGIIYKSSINAEFLSYDDNDNVVNNVSIQQLSVKNIATIFSSVHLYMYTPVTNLSYAIDYKINGFDAFYFKLTNLLLHLTNVLLIYILSFQLFKKNYLAVFIAVLFSLHPMNTSTISWISTRSNLLATMFFLLSIILYNLYYNNNKKKFLTLSFLAFAFSLLSKSSGIMLPVTLLLFDYFNQRKFSIKILIEKIPFFIASCIIGFLTIYFRTDSGNTQSSIDYTIFDRIFFISFSIISYTIKSIIPIHLSEVYAYPTKSNGFLSIWFYITPLLLLCIVFLIKKLKVLKREIIFGLLFFLINIIVTQFAMLEDGFNADRYTYLPYFGLLFIIVSFGEYFIKKYFRYKYLFFSIIAIELIIFSVFTYNRSLHWENTLTLFDNVIEVEPESAFAHNNRGIAKYSNNDYDGALNDYDYAIKLDPKYSGAYYNRGLVNYSLQKFEFSNNDYSKAIELNPNFASSYMARGILEMDIMKNDSLALIDYNNAIKINPSFAQAYYNRGILELRLNNTNEACSDFQKVNKLGYPNADKLIEHYCN